MAKVIDNFKYDVKAVNKMPIGLWPTADVHAEYRGLDKAHAVILHDKFKDEGYNVIVVTECRRITF